MLLVRMQRHLATPSGTTIAIICRGVRGPTWQHTQRKLTHLALSNVADGVLFTAANVTPTANPSATIKNIVISTDHTSTFTMNAASGTTGTQKELKMPFFGSSRRSGFTENSDIVKQSEP